LRIKGNLTSWSVSRRIRGGAAERKPVDPLEPETLEAWARFHAQVDDLPAAPQVTSRWWPPLTALASAAVVITVANARITRARIALGGVGTKPWRSPEAEAELTDQPVTQAVFQKAAEAALRDAKPQSQNGFKIELAKRCLVHALKLATQIA